MALAALDESFAIREMKVGPGQDEVKIKASYASQEKSATYGPGLRIQISPIQSNRVATGLPRNSSGMQAEGLEQLTW